MRIFRGKETTNKAGGQRYLLSPTKASGILVLLVGLAIGWYLFSSVSAAPSSNIVYSTDGGTSWTTTPTVKSGQEVLVRQYYNNDTSGNITDARMSTTLPSGFTRVAGSTRTCLNPGTTNPTSPSAELACSNDAGQGGAINEGAVWSSSTLSIAPNAGVYGQATNATTGLMAAGKKKYLNLHQCMRSTDPSYDWIPTIVNDLPATTWSAGTNASNAADSAASCTAIAGWPTYAAISGVQNLELTGKRYLNLHQCTFYYGDATNGTRYISTVINNTPTAAWNSGTNTANTTGSSASCGSTGWTYYTNYSNTQSLDVLQNRYVNLHQCLFTFSSPSSYFSMFIANPPSASWGTGTNASNTPDAALNCPNIGSWPIHSTLSDFQAIDLLDTNRGQGFVEYKMVAPATTETQAYNQSAALTGTGTGNPSGNGSLTVEPDLQLTYSTDGGTTWTTSPQVESGATMLVRVFSHNKRLTALNSTQFSTALPAGFNLVPNTTRTCLSPGTTDPLSPSAELMCNNTAGQGGAIVEGTVWTGNNLAISPTAGLYGQPTNATSGYLASGKKKYINLHQCARHTDPSYDWITIVVDDPPAASWNADTNASNTADSAHGCGTPGGWTVNPTVSGVQNLDLLGKRYVNLHQCAQYYPDATNGNRWINRLINSLPAANWRTGTNSANVANSVVSCAEPGAGWTNYPPFVGVQALDVLNNRYFNLHECVRTSAGSYVSLFIGSPPTAGWETGTKASNTPDTSLNCPVPGSWVTHTTLSDYQVLDLLDQNRGQTFVEFAVTTPNPPVQTDYPHTAALTGTGTGDQTAEDTITVLADQLISGRLLDGPGGAGINGKKISLLLNGGSKVTVTTAFNANGDGQDGEYVFNDIDLQGSTVLAVFVDDETQNGATITRDNDADITGLDIIQNNLTVRHEDAGPITNNNIYVAGGFSGTADTDLTALFTIAGPSNGTLSTTSGTDLRVRSGETYTPGGSLDLEQDLVIESTATLNAPPAINLVRDWINQGSFAAGSGTVIFDGASQEIVGNTTFNNLIKNETSNNGSSTTLTVDTAGITVLDTLTLDGLDADDRLLIRSSTPGNDAPITFSGTNTAHAIGNFIDVQDSALTNTAGSNIGFPISPASSYDSGNTTNWFGNLLVEFTNAAANDAEATGGNLPFLTVSGYSISSSRTIEVMRTGGSATPGTDFTFASPVTVTIPAGNYNSPQTVNFTTTITDDGILESAETIVFGLQNPASGVALGDADGAGGNETAHTYTITDDETASVQFQNPSSTTGGDEDGAPVINARLTINATTGTPSMASGTTVKADVGFNGGGSTAANGTDLTFSNQTITFTDADGHNALKPITYSLQDDSVIEGNETAIFTLAANATGTHTPSIGTNNSHTLTINDDDVPGVALVQTGGTTTTTEGGSGDIFTVRLTARPASNVTVNFTNDDGDLQAITSVTFTPGDWDIPQAVTVNAADDNTIEGAHTDHINYSTTSADGNFNNLAADNAITVNITDNDTAGATITVTDDLTSEDGETGQFCIVLTARPTADVTIALSSANTDEVTVPASVTITPANWNNASANCVTTTGVDDTPPVGDGTQAVTITTGNVTSTDTDFDALDGATIDNVIMNNQNNDPPGIAVEVIDSTSGEDGATARVRFRLLSQPGGGANVTVPLSLSDATEGSLSGTTSITITNANWNTPTANEVTITGADDDLDDGDIIYQLITGDPTSADGGYDALTAADAANPSLTNVDNDTPAVNITETSGSTNAVEGGATDTVSVVLATQPAPGNVVVITVQPHPQVDLGAGAGVAIQLTFTNADWNTPQNVTVTAVNDNVLEGNHTASVTYGIDAGATTENGYDGVSGLPTTTVNMTDNDTATASISKVNDAGENPATSGTFRVTLSKPNNTGSPITVNYSVAGTASAGNDYTALSGSVNIPNGANEATVTVDTTGRNDNLLEGSETVILTLTGTNNPAVTIDGAADDATMSITDDETATASLSVTTNGSEAGPADMVYTVTLSQANNTGAPITFAINPTGGTATATTDYADFAGQTVSIPNGATTGTLNVAVVDDALLEGSQTVQATISNPSLSSVSIGTAAATATITDNETATASITATDPSAAESPADSGTFTVSLSQINNTGSPITVNYSVGGTASPGSDYTALSGSVQIPNGSSFTTITVDTSGHDDSSLEGNETVMVTLTGASHPSVSLGAPNSGTVTIIDNETVTANLSVTTNGDETGPVNAVFTVTLSTINNTGSPITVTIANSGGTATSDSDFASFAGTVSIPNGASSAARTVAVTDDSLLESTETLQATISNPSSGSIGISNATATITDNETATASITATDATAAESPADNATFTVNLSKVNNSGGPITVTYTVNGTATAGSDYAVLTGTVQIPNGASSATILINTSSFEDSNTEGDETVILTLAGTDFANVVLSASPSASITITDSNTTPDPDPDPGPEPEPEPAPSTPDVTPTPAPAPRRITTDTPTISSPPAEKQPVPQPKPVDDEKDKESDGDGISDKEEDRALNNGDGNGDGIPDKDQASVASLVSSVTGRPVTLAVTGGDCQAVKDFKVVDQKDLEKRDQDYRYSHGLFDYKLTCSKTGQNATVTFYFDREYNDNWTWRKFNRFGLVYATVGERAQRDIARVGSHTVTTMSYSITDGDDLDEDSKANGVILDPSGPGVQVAGYSWAWWLLLPIVIILWLLWRRRRERRKAKVAQAAKVSGIFKA